MVVIELSLPLGLSEPAKCPHHKGCSGSRYIIKLLYFYIY